MQHPTSLQEFNPHFLLVTFGEKTMTTLRTAKCLIAATRALPLEAVPLAHVVLAYDEALPRDIKAGLTETLLKMARLEPMSRLSHLTAESLILSNLAKTQRNIPHSRMVAVHEEIKAMDGGKAVAAAFVWFSTVCAVVLHNENLDAPEPALH
jgi:hypothetical protein